ncbi:hypothetical protein MN608_11836 [Microdochium nivale]|nr:hypothetical protein MN608_11836 [Microdochium nivale]
MLSGRNHDTSRRQVRSSSHPECSDTARSNTVHSPTRIPCCLEYSSYAMTQRTWFLPPHFAFMPEGDLALGTVIAHPSRPTRILATLNAEHHPDIVLPEVQSILEENHQHSKSRGLSLGGSFLAKITDLASASAEGSISRSNVKSLGNVDLEVRTFKTSLSAVTLQKIVNLKSVKKHRKQSLLGNRAFYIITGLRVAKDSFEVLYEKKSEYSASGGASGPAPATPTPVELEGKATAKIDRGEVDEYTAAPGVVYAYQVHVVRAKKDDDATTELFGHRTAFLTGEGADDEEDEEPCEMEYVEVNASVLESDQELVVPFSEHKMDSGEEACISFQEN